MAQRRKGLLPGIFDGVTGVFLKPIQGAQEEGVEGFFKGIGKGAVGLVTRPVGGVIDLVSETVDSVERIAESATGIQRHQPPQSFQSENVGRYYNRYEAEDYKLPQQEKRHRPPQYFQSDNVGQSYNRYEAEDYKLLQQEKRHRPPQSFQSDNVGQPYNRHEAEGCKLLQDVENGRFASTDVYMAHAFISLDRRIVVLITDKRLMMVSLRDTFGQWNCDWQVPWDDIKGKPKALDDGVLILLKESKGSFESGGISRFIPTRNAEVAVWIISKLQVFMSIRR